MWIFRAWVTTKSGERIYARDYGKRAFKIWVTKQPTRAGTYLGRASVQVPTRFVEPPLQDSAPTEEQKRPCPLGTASCLIRSIPAGCRR